MRRHAAMWIAIGVGALTAACATAPGGTTTATSTTTTTSGGEVALGAGDDNGSGLTAYDVRVMTGYNMVAHIAVADSLEVLLARAGAARAQDSTVRRFANRMALEHSDHLQTANLYGLQNAVIPVLFRADSADTLRTPAMLKRLSLEADGPTFDRRFMSDEVETHERILRDLTMMQPVVNDLARPLVDQTIPITREHLDDARRILRQLGGSSGSKNVTSENPS